MLQAHGFQCHGIDVGNRAKVWGRRTDPSAFTRAAVQRMPFRDAEFDFAFLNCVLPHVGVVGDSQTVAQDYAEQRRLSVQEAIRVVRPGGHIMLSNPNRLCPLDLFHRKNERTHWPRFHGWGEPFLQSFADHRRSFVQAGGCRAARLLPPGRFWGFNGNSKSSRYALGRVLQASIRAYLALLSQRFMTPLRSSPVNPWLVVLVDR
jgi:SAM-dependent methyltransferase